jgi:carboxylesterase type B
MMALSTAVARSGVVTVTVNYRLAAEGFLCTGRRRGGAMRVMQGGLKPRR